MVPPFRSNHVPPVDMDFVTFINEFLFNPPPQVSSARSALRHQRTPLRHKRYKTMWRAAATALMKKRYSSQETHVPFEDHVLRELPSHDNGQSSKESHLSISDHLHRKLPSQVSLNISDSSQATSLLSADEPLKNLPLGVSVDEGNSSQVTYLSSADQLLRNLSSQVVLDDGHGFQSIDTPSADKLLRNILSQGSLDNGGVLIEAAPFSIPACSKLKKKGPASGCCSKAQPLEAISTPVIPKHSSRKPPRPPRGGLSRSGSYRAIHVKIAARRVMMGGNERMRKQKLSKSTPNATSMWALIITLCFASIMLVQGFLGSNSKDFGSKAEGQPVGQGVSSLSPYLEAPPFASESSTQTLRKVPRDLPFMNLQRYWLRRLGAISWHLL